MALTGLEAEGWTEDVTGCASGEQSQELQTQLPGLSTPLSQPPRGRWAVAQERGPRQSLQEWHRGISRMQKPQAEKESEA